MLMLVADVEYIDGLLMGLWEVRKTDKLERYMLERTFPTILSNYMDRSQFRDVGDDLASLNCLQHPSPTSIDK